MSAPPPVAPPPAAAATDATDGLRCPKCRTVNYPGLMGFPRCHSCHEQLRQCRWCLHQSGGLCQLDEAERPALQGEDGLPWCEAFSSRHALSEAAKPLERPLGITPRTIGGLAFGCVLVIWLILLALGEEHGLRLEARDEAVRVVDGRAACFFTLRGDGSLSSVLLDLDLREAPGYTVEELVVPAGLRLAPDAASRVAAPAEVAAKVVEVHLMAAPEAPTRGRLLIRLEAMDGEALAVSTVRLLRPGR